MNIFLQKQGQLIFQENWYGILLTSLLLFLPFGSWLAVAIISLMTLRRGCSAGSKLLAVGIISTFIFFQLGCITQFALLDVLLTLILGYISAYLLRTTASWNVTATALLLISMSSLFLVYMLLPEYISEQFNMFVSVMDGFVGNNILQTALELPKVNKLLLANYVFGVKAFSLLFSSVSAVLFARYIQSLLFYPGGFKQEVMSFRANYIGLIGLLLILLGINQHSLLAIICAPILAGYLVAAGISISANFLNKRANKFKWLFIVIPIAVIPYIILPFYIVIGSLDIIFNFRLRLQLKQEVKH